MNQSYLAQLAHLSLAVTQVSQLVIFGLCVLTLSLQTSHDWVLAVNHLTLHTIRELIPFALAKSQSLLMNYICDFVFISTYKFTLTLFWGSF